MPSAIARLASTLVLACAAAIVVLVHPRLFYLFREKVGYWPHLAAPRTYRERMQWRKIFDRNPCFVRLQDKLASKEIVRSLVPDQPMPAVLWSGDDPGAIPMATLPSSFVLKSNHGRGFNVMADEGRRADRAVLMEKGRSFLRQRWGRMKREWAYSRIVPRLFVEETLRTADGRAPDEYAVTVMNGAPLFITAQRSEDGRTAYGYYTPTWRRLPVTIGLGTRGADVPRPRCLDAMLRTASAVGGLVDMLRVDFYDVDGVAYFGECTVYSVSGMLPVHPVAFDLDWGRRWDIGRAAFFTAPLGPFGRIYRWALAIWLAAERAGGRGSGVTDR